MTGGCLDGSAIPPGAPPGAGSVSAPGGSATPLVESCDRARRHTGSVIAAAGPSRPGRHPLPKRQVGVASCLHP